MTSDPSPGTDTPGVRVWMHGRFEVTVGSHRLPLSPGGKLSSLIAVLALHREYGLARDDVVSRLWPEADLEHGCQSLNSLVHDLRMRLTAFQTPARLVAVEGGRYRLERPPTVTIDAVDFDEACAAAARAERAQDRHLAILKYEGAVAMYRGDLVAEIDQDPHFVLERERLREQYLRVLSKLGDWAFAAADYDGAVRSAMRMLAADACREDAHRLLMRSFVRTGRRAQALRQFEICSGSLDSAFGAVPEEATRELFERVRLTPSES